jgi:hypothetical protein
VKRFLLISSLLICVLLVAGGLFLKRGVTLESFSTGPANLSNISLKWQNKLELQIENLAIEIPQNEAGQQSPDLSIIEKIVPLVKWVDRFFSKISIQKISASEISGSLLYQTSRSHIKLSSSLLAGRVNIRLDGNTLIADFKDLHSEKFHTRASGGIRFDLKEKSGGGQFSVNITASLPMLIKISLDTKQFSFEGQENGKITTITPFVDLFGLEQNIQQWITEYLTGSRYELKTFKGDFPWSEPLHILESFYAEVRVHDCEYTFAPGLEAIKSDYGDVVFQKGVLVILPHDATFYGQDTEDSWLDIDFNDPDNILLTAKILTHAQANQDIINLVKYYDIPLPFLQTEGKTKTDLTLTVNLETEQVTAHGTFIIDDGRVDYSGENYGVKNAVIGLDDTVITFKQLEVSFEDMFVADVKGLFDAEKDTGALDIVLLEGSFEMGGSVLALDSLADKPTVHCEIHPEGSIVTGSASSWTLGVLPLQFGSFTSTGFSLDELSGKLTPTLLSFQGGVSAEVSGSFSISDQVFDMQAKLLKCEVNDLTLVESQEPLTVQYDNGLKIRCAKESKWLLNDVPLILAPSEFRLEGNVYSMTGGSIAYGDYFESDISGHYNHETKQGIFQLEKLVIKEESFGNLLTPDETVSVEIDGREDKLLFTVPALDIEFSSDAKKGWSLIFRDLAAVYDLSPILQQYMVDAGSLAVVSKNDGQWYRFSANISYRYALLAKDGKPVSQYIVYGKAGSDGLTATINDDVQLSYTDKILISSKGSFFNLPGIIQLIKDYSEAMPEESKEEMKLQCRLEAEDTGVILMDDRTVLADRISLEYISGHLKGQLKHGAGSVSMDIEDKEFSIAGEKLNETFMDALIPGSDFKKGSMAVAAKGNFDEYSVVVKITDTVLKEFNTLNNILAMVNTIPALITFSLPSYSLKGLPVDSLVAGLTIKGGMGTFDTLELESPEISMLGAGWIDFVREQIGMDLNLITRAKHNINKIPLVGYILVGKEKRPSITVKVSGDLLNPDVEHSIFQEVATQPFSMVFRTLALPGYLASRIFGLEPKSEQDVKDKPKAKDKLEEDSWDATLD